MTKKRTNSGERAVHKPSKLLFLKPGPAPLREHDMIGQRYRLLKKIGQGGMGFVWCAEDTRLYNRRVAIKFIKLHEEARKNATSKKRFMREAFLSSQLSHPNLATIYEFFEYGPEGQWCMVFEFISGETLNKYIRREKKLDPLTVAHIALQLSHALGQLHRAGLLHRDLKPDNIMLTALQEPSQYLHLKLIDLGIAKLIEPEEQQNNTKERIMKVPLTATGFVCGTPEYMSPEQTRGEPLSVPSDIFAVGVLIFEMLAGVPPLRCREWSDFLQQRSMHKIPSVSIYTHYRIPARFQEVLDTCLAYRPEDRYQSANELAEALELVLFEAYGQILPLSNLHLSEHGRSELSAITKLRTGHPLELSGQELSAGNQPTVQPAELNVEQAPPQAPSAQLPSPDFTRKTDAALNPLSNPLSVSVTEALQSEEWMSPVSEDEPLPSLMSGPQHWLSEQTRRAHARFMESDPQSRVFSIFAVCSVVIFFSTLFIKPMAHRDGSTLDQETRQQREHVQYDGQVTQEDAPLQIEPNVKQANINLITPQTSQHSDVLNAREQPQREQERAEEARREAIEQARVEGERSFMEAKNKAELQALHDSFSKSTQQYNAKELKDLKASINAMIKLSQKVQRVKDHGKDIDVKIDALLDKVNNSTLKAHPLFKGWREAHNPETPPQGI
jgi:serine/threonine-protein kinase